MRVAIFAETYFPFISGVVTHIQTLKQSLEAEGHEVLIVTMSPDAKYHYVKDNVLYCPAVSLKNIYGYGVANPINRKRLRIVKKFNPDVIHIHTEFTMGLFALYVARRLRRPVVYTLHTMYDDYIFYLFPNHMNHVAKPMAHAYIRKIAAKSTELIGPSTKVVEYMRRCGVNKPVTVVPNAVDISSFLPHNVTSDEKETAAQELGIKDDDVSLVFVGRLGKEKSIDVLIEYFCKSFDADENFKLFIIGEGPEKEKLHNLVAEFGREEQIKLVGQIDHHLLKGYYQACDLYTTASLTEMHSISLLEATASGLYAIQRLDIANRHQISTGVNGEAFTTQYEFEDIVRGYAALPQEKRNKKKQVVSNHAAQYGPPQFAENILDVYKRALVK